MGCVANIRAKTGQGRPRRPEGRAKVDRSAAEGDSQGGAAGEEVKAWKAGGRKE